MAKSGGGGVAPIAPLPGAPEFGATTEDLLNQQALSSILNVSGPFGTSGITGSAQEGFTKETALSPELQALYQKVLDPSAGDAYTQSYFDRASKLMAPGRARTAEAEDVMFAGRGLPEGSQIRRGIEKQSQQDIFEADERLALSSILQGEQQQGRDLQEFMQLASGVGSATGPNINTLASYQLPYQAEVLPYMQEINRQNLMFGAENQAQQQAAQNKQNQKSGLFGAGGNVATAALL